MLNFADDYTGQYDWQNSSNWTFKIWTFFLYADFIINKRKEKNTRSSDWFLCDPHISGLNICVDGGDTGWWKLWEKKQVTWAKGEWNFICMGYVVSIPTGASKWYPTRKKNTKTKIPESTNLKLREESGWRCPFGNYLLMVTVKARAWVRSPEWSFGAGEQEAEGPPWGRWLLLGEQRRAVCTAGWKP